MLEHQCTSAPRHQLNMENNTGYRKLIVWQKADELAYQVYLATRNFPNEEKYGIISQMRRAALSVPINIAEGYGRQNKGELKQFVNISLGSLAETEYLLDFSLRLKYFVIDKHKYLQDLRHEVGSLLWKFYKSL